MDKRFIAILIGLVVIFGGILAFTGKSDNNSGSGGSSQTTNHVEGQNKKGVTLVEYGDYECPVCEGYYPIVKQVAAKFSKDIHFQFRNLPLISIHPNAFAGARAAEAAALQNKFWEMHDTLYDQNNWQAWSTAPSPTSFFNAYAQQLGLNLDQFKQDYASSKVNDSINADLAAFKATGQQQATPSFFVNGAFVDNGQLTDPTTHIPSVDKFSAVINAAIKSKSN